MRKQALYLAQWRFVVDHIIDLEYNLARVRRIQLRFVARIKWKYLRLGLQTWKVFLLYLRKEEVQAESKVIQRNRLCTKCIFKLITRLIRIYFKQWHQTIEAINTVTREKRNSVEQQKRIIVRMLKGALMKAWSRWQDAQRCLRLSLRYARRIYENVNARRLSRLKRGYFEWMRVTLAQLRKDNSNSRLVPQFRAQMMNNYFLKLVEKSRKVCRQLQVLHGWAKVSQNFKQTRQSIFKLCSIFRRNIFANISRKWRQWRSVTQHRRNLYAAGLLLLGKMNSAIWPRLVRIGWSKWCSFVLHDREDGDYSVQFTLISNKLFLEFNLPLLNSKLNTIYMH